MNWLVRVLLKSSQIEEFQSFVLENMPLSGIATIANPEGYWLTDKNGYFLSPQKAREILSMYIARFTDEHEQQNLMNQQGTFDITMQGPSWTITFNGQPFNINISAMHKIMTSGRDQFIRITNAPPPQLEQAIEDRRARLRGGAARPERELRAPAPNLDIGSLSTEAMLRYANIAGWLMKTTVYYVDEPQIKRTPLPEELLMAYRLGPGATLRDLGDEQIVNLYYDLLSDFKYGDNSSGFNPQARKYWPEMMALNAIFDRRSFQPHLEIRFSPPYFTAEHLAEYIGPLTQQDADSIEQTIVDESAAGLIIAWKHSVASFADNFGISHIIPVRLEKGFEVDRLLESFRRGVGSQRQTLEQWGAVPRCKEYIMSQVPPEEQSSVEAFFDFGFEGQVNFEELKLLIAPDNLTVGTAQRWRYLFKY